MRLFHDDDCGATLEADDNCPKCGFHPDMQSLGLREANVNDIDIPEIRTIVKPLHVQVAEKLGCKPVCEQMGTDYWACFCLMREHTENDENTFPSPNTAYRYDLDWSATGPIIERLGLGVYLAADGWRARKSDRAVHINSVRHASPLLAVCNLILALPDAAVRG